MTSGEGSSFSRSSTGLTVRGGNCARASSAATRKSPCSLRSSAMVVSRSRTMVPWGSARSPRARARGGQAHRGVRRRRVPGRRDRRCGGRESPRARAAATHAGRRAGFAAIASRSLPHGARPDHREARNRRVAPGGLVGTVGGQVRDEPLHFLACRSSDRHVRVSRIDGKRRRPDQSSECPAFLAEHPGDHDAEQVERDHRPGHQRLVHHVARRRDDGGQDEDDQDRVLRCAARGSRPSPAPCAPAPAPASASGR